MSASSFLRLTKLMERTGWSRASIYRLVAKGEMPAPYLLSPTGRAVGWLESDVDAYIESRVAAATKPAVS